MHISGVFHSPFRPTRPFARMSKICCTDPRFAGYPMSHEIGVYVGKLRNGILESLYEPFTARMPAWSSAPKRPRSGQTTSPTGSNASGSMRSPTTGPPGRWIETPLVSVITNNPRGNHAKDSDATAQRPHPQGPAAGRLPAGGTAAAPGPKRPLTIAKSRGQPQSGIETPLPCVEGKPIPNPREQGHSNTLF